MTIIKSLIRFGTRKLHTTIVSKEIIKPSFPTPSHLKTYNLSVLDQSMPSAFVPIVLFYPNTGIYRSSYDKSLELKNSLSQTLTKYYQYAGRHAKIGPTYVECNDDGVEFLEATIDSPLLSFLQSSQPKDLDQFFPYPKPWRSSKSTSDSVIPLLAVQVNHFECGGVGVAASLSHKMGDASSMVQFLSDWAKVTRVCPKTQKCDQAVPIEPHFIHFEKKSLTNHSHCVPDVLDNCVTRSFMFPNAKINDLKLKVEAMTEASGERKITKPTRVEVLTWLLYKCALAASTKNNSNTFKPAWLYHVNNFRQKMIEPLPENSNGNFIVGIKCRTTNESELKPDALIGELRKQNMQIKGLKNIEDVFASLLTASSFDVDYDNAFIFSSICRYPIYGIDFGWGTPIKASTAGNYTNNFFVLMDAPNEEGIEVLACLDEKDMDIFQRDPELLEFM